MSSPYDGSDWDRPMQSTAGSVKRAREMAQQQQGAPRRPPPPMMPGASSGLSPPPSRSDPTLYSAPQNIYKQKVAPAIQGRIDQQSTSRPNRMPQWPLPASPQSSADLPEEDLRRPPPNRAQPPPQRPPRPSVVPSLVDASRPQQHTPVFSTRNDEEYDDVPDFVSPTSESRYTNSSVGTIPDFPEPSYVPNTGGVPPRRSANLGPPPSSRRGASSFYSHASYVSPIPEESPRSRSYVSGASSAVIPDNGRLDSPISPAYPVSPGYGDAFYDDSFTDRSRESVVEEFGDESKLVRSASIGKKGKPSLVVTRGPSTSRTPDPDASAFAGGTALRDDSNSSLTPVPSNKTSPDGTPDEKRAPKTADAMLGVGAVSGLRNLTPSPKPPSRLSAMRRPPRLDMDAVREMEARGSTTSLTDLIKRATRLASMMDRGKRPASRFDNLNDLLDRSGGSNDKDVLDEKHQSGLSDMLAAFPPPVQDARTRGSWFQRTSWPLAPGRPGQQPGDVDGTEVDEKAKDKGRRCCGMPRWVFIILVIIILLVIAAAVVIPLQFFVFKTIGPQAQAQSSLDQCRTELKCQNGGANVMVNGNCSCICTGGFVGKTCDVGGEKGCTTTNLVSSNGETTVSDVTLGRAVPRIVAHSEDNFTIPLSGTAILARFSTANLSCIAQNSLVTFNGRATRVGFSGSEDIRTISAAKDDLLDLAMEVDETFEEVPALTEPASMVTAAPQLVRRVEDDENQTTEEKLQLDTSASSAPSKTASSKTAQATDDDNFRATEDTLDFARVAVMYVLQEKSLTEAEGAQGVLQRFFSRTGTGDDKIATKEEAAQLRLSGDTTVDLIKFRIKLQDKEVGLGTNETDSNTKREVPLTPIDLPVVSSRQKGTRLRRGHSR